MPKRKIRQYISERTLEFLRAHGAKLIARVPPHAEKAFVEEYRSITGHEPEHYFHNSADVDKRWWEGSVYFTATPYEAATLLVEWTRDGSAYCIHDNDFFMAIVEKGFRLENSPEKVLTSSRTYATLDAKDK